MAQDATSKVILGMDVREFRKGISQVDSSIKSMSRKFQNLGGIIGASFAFSKIQAFSQEAIQLNSQLTKAAAGFKRFGDVSDLDQMRQSTRGLVTDLELMQQSVKGANLGIPLRDMGTLLEFAKRRADETGESMDHLVNSIVEGIGRKSTRRLDNLGISAQRLKEEVGGISLEMADVADVSAAMTRIAVQELDKMGEAGLTAADELKQLTVEFENFMAVAGGPIAKAVGFTLRTLITEPLEALSKAKRDIQFYLGNEEEAKKRGLSQDPSMMSPSIFYNPNTQTDRGETIKAIVSIKSLTDNLADLKKAFDESEIGSAEFNSTLAEMITLEERINEILTPTVEGITLQAKGVHDLGLAYGETNGVVQQFGDLQGKLNRETLLLNQTLQSYSDQLRSIMVIGQQLGDIFKASFDGAMLQGLDFFDTLREGLKNYVKQMAVAVASTLALAAALSIIFPNIGFRAAFNVLGGGMGLPFGFNKDNQLTLGIKGNDLFTAVGRNTTQNTRIGG